VSARGSPASDWALALAGFPDGFAGAAGAAEASGEPAAGAGACAHAALYTAQLSAIQANVLFIRLMQVPS
jgi:hypothetical protein